MRPPRELAGAQALVTLGRRACMLERFSWLAESKERHARRDRSAAPHPWLDRHPLALLQRPVQPARKRMHAIPGLVEEDGRGDDRVALGESLANRPVEQGEVVGLP